MACPKGSKIVTESLEKRTLQLASQKGPILTSEFLKAGKMWTLQSCSCIWVGRDLRVAEYFWVWYVAVPKIIVWSDGLCSEWGAPLVG